MPITENEPSDFIESEHFQSLDFRSGYWQCPFEPEVYEASGTIALQGTFVSTLILHGLKNVSAYFQLTIPPLFENTKHAMKA